MENLSVITSQKLLFGGRNNYFYPARLDLDLSANKLYRKLTKLEEELKAWRNVWHLTYLQEVKKIMKFKENSQYVEEDAVVMISDHLNEETLQPALGIVLRKFSERTFEILYIKKHAKLDLNGKIIKKAVHSTLTRPIQSLIFLFNTKKTSEASIDPFWSQDISGNQSPKVSPDGMPHDKRESVNQNGVVLRKQERELDLSQTQAPLNSANHLAPAGGDRPPQATPDQDKVAFTNDLTDNIYDKVVSSAESRGSKGSQEVDDFQNVITRVQSLSTEESAGQKERDVSPMLHDAATDARPCAALHQGDIEHQVTLQTYNVPEDAQSQLEDEIITDAFPSVIVDDNIDLPSAHNEKKEVQQSKPGPKVKFVRDRLASSVITLPQRKLRPRNPVDYRKK